MIKSGFGVTFITHVFQQVALSIPSSGALQRAEVLTPTRPPRILLKSLLLRSPEKPHTPTRNMVKSSFAYIFSSTSFYVSFLFAVSLSSRDVESDEAEKSGYCYDGLWVLVLLSLLPFE